MTAGILEQFEQWLACEDASAYLETVKRVDEWMEENRDTSIAWATDQDIRRFLWTEPSVAAQDATLKHLQAFGRFLADEGFVEEELPETLASFR